LRIRGVTRQWEGGGYYRVRRPLAELAEHGHVTDCVPAKSDVTAGGADVVVGHLIGGDNRWWRRLAKTARLVYEVDDDPFEVEPWNPRHHIYADPVAQDSIAHCLQVADLVTVSTKPLAERMRAYNPNVVVLQNRIDAFVLDMERPKRDKLVIGWAGSDSHMMDIPECAYGLRKTLLRNSGVEAHFIGADLRFLVGNVPIRHTGWCLNTTAYYRLIDFDIGLAPLRSSVFAETKSHIKALEYAALGIPVVASDCAAYRDFVVDGVTGWLVRRPHEWASRLRELVNDAAMREEMGAKARALAANWTVENGWQEWEAAYAPLCA
jgi:glycosyltransferase involved in cell wall biosynthesis